MLQKLELGERPLTVILAGKLWFATGVNLDSFQNRTGELVSELGGTISRQKVQDWQKRIRIGIDDEQALNLCVQSVQILIENVLRAASHAEGKKVFNVYHAFLTWANGCLEDFDLTKFMHVAWKESHKTFTWEEACSLMKARKELTWLILPVQSACLGRFKGGRIGSITNVFQTIAPQKLRIRKIKRPRQGR